MYPVRFILGVLLVLFLTQSVGASGVFLGIRRDFEGTRAQGMGNAFTAVADDHTAIFYNAAGLGQLEESEVHFFVRVDGGLGIFDLAQDLRQAWGDGVQEVTRVLEANYGSHYSLRPSLGFSWAGPDWGLAFIPLDPSVDVALNQSAGPALDLLGLNDSTLAFAYNWTLFEGENRGSLRWGFTSKLVYRWSLNQRVIAADLALNKGDNILNGLNRGWALDGDWAFMWQGPWSDWNPSAALVVRNLFSGHLGDLKASSSDPFSSLQRVVDLGSSLALPRWGSWTSRLALDLRDLLHPNWNWRKGFHLGTEFLWDPGSWFVAGLRAGLNQGYWTLGLTTEWGFLRWDFATYGEEVGIEEERLENRRYMLTLSLDF